MHDVGQDFLPRAIRPDKTKNLTVLHRKRHFVNRHRRAVGLADFRNLNDRSHDALRNSSASEADAKLYHGPRQCRFTPVTGNLKLEALVRAYQMG